MKRTLAVAAILLFSVQAGATELHRYFVGTRRPARELPQLVTSDLPGTDEIRRVEPLLELNGFIAELTEQEAVALAQSPEVRYVEREVERHALGLVPAANDTRNLLGQTLTYGIDAVRAREVWPVSKGSGVNVAVIDTGIDYTHPELKDAYAGGHDFVQNDEFPMDEADHGTHVSGIIAAADNTIGTVGVAPAVRLWGVRVLNAKGSGSTADVIRGVDWVIAKKRELGGRWIINLSLGSADSSISEEEAMGRAVAAGIIAVAASGNSSTDTVPAPVSYPAAYPGMLAIGATDDKNAIGTFSNQGAEVAIVAPGVNVLSTLPVGSGLLAYATVGTTAYAGAPITGSKEGSVSGPFVFCNLGKLGEFPASVSGKIALIKRGDIRFSEKAKNAKEAGATGVIIFNRDDSALSFTLINEDEPGNATYAWPITIALSLQDGEALVAQPTASVSVKLEKDDYGRLSGTSMATPHAAGVTALVWGAAPNATAEMVRDAIVTTAKDLGATGRDNVFGSGLADALNAAKKLVPSAFGNPTTPVPFLPSGRRILIRGR